MSDSLTILVVTIDAWGHVNPMISVVGPLKSAGHRVIFMTEKTWEGKLAKFGFEEEIFTYNDNDETKKNASEHWFKTLIESGFLKDLNPLEKMKGMMAKPDERVTKMKKFNQKLKLAIDKIKPDLLVVDSMFVTPFIVKSNIKWISVFPANPLTTTIFDKRSPPPGSGLPTNDSKDWEEFRNETKEIVKMFRKQAKEWWSEEKYDPPLEETWVKSSPYLNVYFYPKELDYDDLRPVPKNFVQFDWLPRQEEKFEMPDELKDKPGKWVYFSMGSLGSGDVELMKKLTNYLSNSPHRFIVSKGMFGETYELPANCWGKNHLPQTSVLQLVDLAIIHGGNNSFCEAFYFGKPMIVMPLFGDQYDNAQRVQEKGFGLRLDPYKCTQEELLGAIEKLNNDTELAEKMKKATERIKKESNDSRIVKLVDEIFKF